MQTLNIENLNQTIGYQTYQPPTEESRIMVASVHVAVGLIFNDSQARVLIAQRPLDTHQGGLWEFPGGKVEVDETAAEALKRELYEELAITVIDCVPLFEVKHDYPDKSVLLDIWQVSRFNGLPKGCEGQPVQWVLLHEINKFQFPAANYPILDYLSEHRNSK